MEDKEKLQIADNLLQNYFKEANRTVDIKIFKAQIKYKDLDQLVTIYFVNRLEIGQL